MEFISTTLSIHFLIAESFPLQSKQNLLLILCFTFFTKLVIAHVFITESSSRHEMVKGSIPGRDIPKPLKMASCSLLGSQTYGVELGLVNPVSRCDLV